MSVTRFTAPVAFVLTAGLLLAGCSSSAPSAPTESSSAIAVNEELAATVPAAIREAGVIRVATDPTYPPFESVDGDQVVGLDADLAHAIGDILDLDIEFVQVSFDGIIPSLQAGSADMALSSIGDNKEREQAVDFATAYWNGTLLLVPVGNPLEGTPELSCNMNVGVIRGSLQQTEFLPAQAQPCEDAGEQAPVEAVYQNSNQAVLALTSNRIDGVLIDAPAVALAVSQSSGTLEAAGPIIRNPNPAGAAFPKDSELVEPVAAAINELIQSGVYADLLTKWDLSDIAIKESVINGAVE
ncbi:ABC transporter substrate-binding protein [Microbacterium sp. PAMC22086]|uniref:ABC transporter substrate-binding protein n=1 Tax=Microbacterium sp. PAMC22086 TaxID=2861281 RepID=UPI001C639B31|nr:ABC transporter substrate-binding protein [Microbacterium sp. PAMC22086]QYG11532.1 ABC transporter substrate-binding protein [Microbacterium sp. PAMC22086]